MKYSYKNKTYTITGEGQFKDVSSGDWVNCVFYVQDESGLMFARERDNFYFKFERVKE